MNANIADKIINQTTQLLPNGRSISLLFHYPANFKIGDLIEVTAPHETLQLLVPQHEEDYFTFDVEIWDDRVRLFCDSMKELKIYRAEGAVFSFKIRDISLFAHRFFNTKNQEMYN
ncbi:MAG: hypothetical protein ACRYFB_09345 [Janthinobacterium lividum]